MRGGATEYLHMVVNPRPRDHAKYSLPSIYSPSALTLDGEHLKNVTELDVSENGISSLDVACLASLSKLRCCHNNISQIILHGSHLTSLHATNNKISKLDVRYHPRRLSSLHLARNNLKELPQWLVSCGQLRLLDVSHNEVTSLPSFLTSGHLRHLHTLLAPYNYITHLPLLSNDTIQSHEEGCLIEVLILHHNLIVTLPRHFFLHFTRLRILNLSSNKLTTLPENGWYDKDNMPIGKASVAERPLQELYVANNDLQDLNSLYKMSSLRVLHAAYNRISNLHERLVESWELLEELVMTGNLLELLPGNVAHIRRLRVLRLHLNPITVLPRLAHLTCLKVVDVSHCRLGRLELETVVGPSLLTLDIAANSNLSLDHHQFSKCKSRRSVSVVDVTSSRAGRSLPFRSPSLPANKPVSDQPIEEKKQQNNEQTTPWCIGFSESIGSDSRMNVGQLRVSNMGGVGQSGIVAVADGGDDAAMVGPFLSLLPNLLQEEQACEQHPARALKYALLAALRRVAVQGKIFPKAVCVAHLDHGNNRGSCLRICSFGDVTAVITTDKGSPTIVKSPPSANQSSSSKSIVDETNKNYSDILTTLPDPHTAHLRLLPSHRSLVLMSSSIGEVLEADEINPICDGLLDPVLAAKRILTLAQSYGARRSLSVIVVNLGPPVRPPRSAKPILLDSHYSTPSNNRNVNFSIGHPVISQQRQMFPKHKRSLISHQESYCDNESDDLRILDRSSPSGQSHSDTSDSVQSKEIAYETSEYISSEKLISNSIKSEKIENMKDKSKVTYYHYPRPEVDTKDPVLHNLPSNKGKNNSHLPRKADIINPPSGFGDESEESDSGLSGLSDGKRQYTDSTSQNSNAETKIEEEQFKSWEYLLARNAKMLYLKELDSLSSLSSRPTSSISVPDIIASSEEIAPTIINSSQPSQHFQRNNNRQSGIRGTFRLLRHRLSMSQNECDSKSGNVQKIKKNSVGHFKRFGSLQNLKYYQENRPYLISKNNSRVDDQNKDSNPQQVQIQKSPIEEIQERSALDSLELESRMHHYWHTGVTCF